MRLVFTLGLLTFLSFTAAAQITFEKGYFIRTDSTRTECLIRNVDWKNNPTQFQYKTDTDENVTMQIQDVAEFGVYDQAKYKILNVDIDRSIFKKTEQSTRSPIFNKETLALKVLVEGTADLYYYEGENFVRFFFGVGDKPVEQLVYKKYLMESDQVGVNESFKQQLLLHVKCGNVTETTVKNLRYEHKALVDYFLQFNQCSGDKQTLPKKTKRNSFMLKLSAGIGVSTLNLDYRNPSTQYDEKFSAPTYHVGVEGELILPFNKDRWSILLGSSFNTFSAKEDDDSSDNQAELNTFEIALGGRHYFFLSENTKLFLDAMVLYYIPQEETIKYVNLSTATNFGGALGAGINYKRLSAETRHYINHQVLANYALWGAKHTKTILILSYRIF